MDTEAKLLAKHDHLIEQVISQIPELYAVNTDGSIYTRVNKRGFAGPDWSRLDKKCPSSEYRFIWYKKKRLPAHRVVFRFFYGALDSSMTINHKDGRPENNQVSNLEMVTHSENQKHRYRVLGHPPVRNRCKLSPDQIRELRKERAETGALVRDLAAKYGISRSSASHIVTRRSYRHIA